MRVHTGVSLLTSQTQPIALGLTDQVREFHPVAASFRSCTRCSRDPFHPAPHRPECYACHHRLKLCCVISCAMHGGYYRSNYYPVCLYSAPPELCTLVLPSLHESVIHHLINVCVSQHFRQMTMTTTHGQRAY